ncbi:Pyridoxine kinase [Delftia tsuruhatensis]|uniref:pyridoxine/pyridoxal/pyridoxamine kinase n=1 Tax=Delftia tsuruhatensis TaxID=180282 RepID=UPI001E6D1DC9|nr:pyridoxine/pyridoxal/pyridoxamine kinase [Delftia tsuruhatensis]CAB5712366.1 Pyridoxine kinase [Delftia tsuruhatensis]CAC9682065.1 Pyridoxine kinase [Delftia tsuruhatensis]
MNAPAPHDMLLPLAIDVVSVQSQVVYGRVGNNVAMPTLEALGLNAAAVPTVLFSNTPHYPSIHGGAIATPWFAGYLQDLLARGALRHLRAVLAGYLGGPAQAALLADWMATLLEQRPGLRVVVDPVIGDHDHGIYVDPGMIEAYRRHLLPLADGLTPNHFELERLTGRHLHGMDEVIAAARSLLAGRTQWVAVTSAAPRLDGDGEDGAQMRVALVTRERSHVITHARVDAVPKGTGDLFSAALTGHWIQGASLQEAAGHACDRIVQALIRTRQARSAELLLPSPSWQVTGRQPCAIPSPA